MDVQCMGCQEPWDTYHLTHDVIYDAICEGGLWPDLYSLCGEEPQNAFINAVSKRWQEQKLTPEVRAAFKLVKWEFGSSVLIVLHCPCCKPGSKPADEETKAKVETLGELLKGDPDGLAAELSEL